MTSVHDVVGTAHVGSQLSEMTEGHGAFVAPETPTLGPFEMLREASLRGQLSPAVWAFE